jgi:hypothetical protein
VSAVWIALSLFCAGCALAVTGTYLLAGPGWALVLSALPFVVLSVVIMRGL